MGIKRTARALGLTREEIRRSKAIAEISPAAKAKVRKLGLDDNQRALLEIAKRSTPKAQLRAVKKIVERKRAARARKASAAAIAKSVFQVNGVDAAGQVLIRRQLKRRTVLAFFEKLMSRPIVVTVCMGSSPESSLHQQQPLNGTPCRGGGAVHSIES